MISICILCACLSLSESVPSPGDISKGVDWLTRYGYLPPPDPYSAQQQTMETLQEAVRTMQRFAGLPETGELDDGTVEMMGRSRCSLPDVSLLAGRRRKRFALTGTVWQKRHLTWKVESFPTSLESGNTRILVGSALAAWSREAPLSFSETAEEADIRIGFLGGSHGDGYPFDGLGGTLGHAFFPGVGPMAGETHMDADELWTYNTDHGTDIFVVAVHEFGHVLGLSHSAAEGSIMRPYYQGTVGEHRRFRLSPDDREGIQALYGKRDAAPGPAPARPTKMAAPPRGPTFQPRPPFLDRCATHFDAIANIRGEVFFFKSRFFWRMQATGNLLSLNPAHIHRFWHGLPPDLPRLDAAYERHNDSRIVFIAGNRFWVFRETQVEAGYPRPLSDYGLDVTDVDGAFVWKHNRKTYFFRHESFWRYDDQLGRLDDGPQPKKIRAWHGLPPAIDDVISWVDGHTYFFKDSQYWQFRDGNVDAADGYPRSIAQDWMYCKDATLPQPSETPAGRDQRGCHCPPGNSAALRRAGQWAISMAAAFSLLAAQ